MEVILSKQCESLVGMLESDKAPYGVSFFVNYASIFYFLRQNLVHFKNLL